ncbi:MAG: lysyl-tRNA synthetase, class, partial [Actinomycetota bacterium]|nr:lysyl-tRNA synthetase, class [Actinomycetota bacterium]
VLAVDVPATGRVLVASDLHLPATATSAATWAGRELSEALDEWVGPGVLVLAGDALELLGGDGAEPRRILAAHPRLVASVQGFARGIDRRVVYLIGNHDARLAWDAAWAVQVADGLSAELALALELTIHTGRGPERVRVEHGHRFDPANAMVEPRNPRETPLGHHVVTELLPALQGSGQRWLAGAEWLADPAAFPAFVASRLAYRRLAGRLWWLLLPFAAAVLLRVPLVRTVLDRRPADMVLGRVLPVIGLVALFDVALIVASLVMMVRRFWAALGEAGVGGARGQAQNDRPRAEARRLVADGWTGFITGHTHHPELTPLGDGFYVNTGCCADVVDGRPARLGFPQVFLPERHLSWAELSAGPVLRVNLVHARTDVPDGTFLERLAARPRTAAPPRPRLVASFPGGNPWPAPAVVAHHRQARRRAAALIGGVGLMDLLSALTPPLRGRLHAVLGVLPLTLPTTAAAAVGLAGLALLLLARGVRRGQRRAWTAAVALLAASGLLHLVKGVDVEEAVVSLAAAVWLLVRRTSFRAAADAPSVRRSALAVVAGTATALLLGTVAVEFTARPRPSLGRAVFAVAERLVTLRTIPLPGRHLEAFLDPVLATIGIGIVVLAGWLVFRPVVTGRAQAAGLARARAVVARHGRDTLAYFALRADKDHFFSGDSVVAYAVFGGVCLVSPDPVGPPAERDEVWARFHEFADHHGWAVAVLGASPEWLTVYEQHGMQGVYIGDEAIVDCSRFTLEGGGAKGLRQAVNRVARHGYRVEFFDDAAPLDDGLRPLLTALAAESRQGDAERGFSMTLGRLFDSADEGVLLAVAFGSDGVPAALCQFVPAPGIDGYSLDVMRRSLGEHPNGLTDFVLVETICRLQQRGLRHLGLNFATMRAVLAGEAGDGVGRRVERWLLGRMSESVQIESLWRFNEKYDPDWRPRYAVFESTEDLA